MALGLSSNLSKTSLVTPGIVTDNLVLKHNYNAGSVIPVSDGAAFFDGSDDYVRMSSDLLTNATTYTVGCWINYLAEDTYDWLFGTDGTTKNFGLNKSGDHIFYREENGEYFSFGNNSNIPLNKWTHLVFASNASKIDCYINGGLLGTITVDSTTEIGGSNTLDETKFTFRNFGAGYETGGAYNYLVNCYLANVFAYSSCLTSAQVKSIMNKNYAGLTSSETTNLLAWWNLDSEVGSDGNAGSGYVLDENSGAGSTTNLGTLT